MADTEKYIHKKEVHNLSSSSIVVTIIIDFFNPSSVLDVGCGIGTWLHSFEKYGIKDYVGINGDYVDRKMLVQYIDEERFIPCDVSFPFDLKRKFDLVISLEVAKHLPEQSADRFVIH